MPYIIKNQRLQFEEEINSLVQKLCDSDDNAAKGELNYIISSILLRIVKLKGERYARYNDLVGVLECCKLEMYRRMIGPYEDTAIIKNGDIN
jgi:hypothetical protein